MKPRSPGDPTKADHLEEMLLLEEVGTFPEEEEEGWRRSTIWVEVPLAKMVEMDQWAL